METRAALVLGAALAAAAVAAGGPASLPLGLAAVMVLGEAVSGALEALAEATGLERRSSLVLVNSLSTAPELVLAYTIGRRGVEAGEPWLVEVSLLSLLVGAAASLLAASLLALRPGGLAAGLLAEAEAPLLRAASAALALIAAYALVEKAYTGLEPAIPWPAAAALLSFMLVYLATSVSRRAPGGGMAAGPLAALAAGMGFTIAAAEAASSGVEKMLSGLEPGAAAVVLGLTGIAGEAVVNLSVARRSPEEAAAGLIAASAAVVLLAYPVLELALPLTLDRYTVYALAALAAATWMLAASIETRRHVDPREAVFTAALSAMGIALLAGV